MERIAVDGIEIAYVDRGRGAPLVLLHGTQADRRQFDVFVPLLGPGIRTISYDQRDTLDSRYGEGAYGMRDLAADCAGLIRALDIGPAHVLGTSFGGAVAMGLAIAHPELVKSLVLSGTTPSWEMVEPMREVGVNVSTEAERDRFMLEVLLTPATIDHDPVAVQEVRDALTTRSPEQMARRNAALTTHDFTEDLATISAPTLVIHGADDRIIRPTTAEWMADRIPGARLHVVEGVRHGLTFERREAVAELVRGFVLDQA